MIVGTAGHIDHGKTALVHALTGIDADRLPEEKRRGITLDLGYAWMPGPDGERIDFVDVPGHERLVHTMIAGATGFDLALLVVAADDGPMPQTREHLATLSLLGVHDAIVAITKSDRADAGRIASVSRAVEALLARSALADAPVVAVSAMRGDGMAALRALVLDAARKARTDRDEAAAFRLPIDRSFALDGAGTVVTGTVRAGSTRPDDELVLLPAGRSVRVRSVHAWNRSVAAACTGQRCALALNGVARADVSRGDWLVAPQARLTSDRIDVALTVWHDEPQPLRSGARVLVHSGTSSRAASVVVLDADPIAPGCSGRAQLVLPDPIAVWSGDRVVLRDPSASRTVAGGTVLDPCAPARYRRSAQRLVELGALAAADPAGRLRALLAIAPAGIDCTRFSAAHGRALPMPADALAVAAGDTQLAIGAQPAAAACDAIVAALKLFHEEHPDEPGPDAGRLRRLCAPRMPQALFKALLTRLHGEHRIELDGSRVSLPAHCVALSRHDRSVLERVVPHLKAAGRRGCWTRDLADAIDESAAPLRAALARLARAGELHQVARDLWYLPVTVAQLCAIARRLAIANEGALSAAAYRDASGIGRNRVVTILEYFDRVGLLRRAGPVHRLRTDCGLFAGETDASVR